MSFSPVQPPDDIAKSLAEKSKMIREALPKPPVANPVRSTAPAAPSKPAKTDVIHPGGKYGDRPGEKRIDTTEMTRPLGSFHTGTPYVPKTGNYTLKEGEAVIPEDKNPYKMVMEGAKKPAKVLHEIRTRKSKNGGFIHEHHYTEPSHHKMEEHTSSSLEEMGKHMAQHGESMGEEMGETPGAEAQEQALGFKE